MSGEQGRTIIVVCEGQTEETFINQVLAPAFYSLRIVLLPQLINTSPGHRGGALSYDRVQRYLRNTLRRSTQPIVTTLIDLYRLEPSLPSYQEAAGKPLEQRLAILNSAFHQNIVEYTGCHPDHFIPYIQPYEFEALLFSNVAIVTALEEKWNRARVPLEQISAGAESPEHINDGPTTHPAAHLLAHLNEPRYSKVLHGPIAAEYITLPQMEAKCQYFAAWLAKLRTLTSED